ncbi:MAG: imidazole glycerol phosphate synthase subunit HisH [Geitlerinemataceae cyanobacterium]
MVKIAVIDYDMGNLHSACKGLENAGGHPQVSDDAETILAADAFVLPGVGAFDPAMQHLRAHGLEDTIAKAIDSGKPFLGICIGMQLLFDGSEEGSEPGLGIVPGMVRRFAAEPDITIPHMGWNQLDYTQPENPLWQGLGASPWTYFVHSYYTDPKDDDMKAATVSHGSQTVTAAIACDNLMAVQFHPEKSSDAGLKLLANFVRLAEARS